MSKIVSNELKNIASQWFVRMRSKNVSDSERLEYVNWLSEDESHSEAYSAIETEWKDLQELESWAATEINELETQIIPPKRSWDIYHLFSGMAISSLVVVLMITFLLPVHKNDIQNYMTMKGEQRKIVLEDGSRIHLNSSSSITLQFTTDVREIELLQGEGLFDVAHERNRPFIVKVRNSKIVAVGTSFSVHYQKDSIAVTVVEGRVAIVPVEKSINDVDVNTSSDHMDVSGVLVEPDQQANVSIEGKIAELKSVDAEKITGWNRGFLILDSTPLREVATELSRYIVGQVRVASDVPDHLVTGVIKISDQETMFQLLAEVVPITPVRQSSQLTMLYSSESKSEFLNSN